MYIISINASTDKLRWPPFPAIRSACSLDFAQVSCGGIRFVSDTKTVVINSRSSYKSYRSCGGIRFISDTYVNGCLSILIRTVQIIQTVLVLRTRYIRTVVVLRTYLVVRTAGWIQSQQYVRTHCRKTNKVRTHRSCRRRPGPVRRETIPVQHPVLARRYTSTACTGSLPSSSAICARRNHSTATPTVATGRRALAGRA